MSGMSGMPGMPKSRLLTIKQLNKVFFHKNKITPDKLREIVVSKWGQSYKTVVENDKNSWSVRVLSDLQFSTQEYVDATAKINSFALGDYVLNAIISHDAIAPPVVIDLQICGKNREDEWYGSDLGVSNSEVI